MTAAARRFRREHRSIRPFSGFVVLASFFCAGAAFADGLELERIFREDAFETFTTSATIRPEVLAALAAVDPDTAFADPGQACNIGCLRFPGLPNKQLVFGGASEGHAYLFYVEGGFGVRNTLVVFETAKGNAKAIWRGAVNAPARSPAALAAAVEERKYVALPPPL